VRALRQAHVAIPALVVLVVAGLALLGAVPPRQPAGGTGASAHRGPGQLGPLGAPPGTSAEATPPRRAGSPPEACSGVAVAAGDELGRAVASHPPGTTFCLQAGVHHPSGVVPKDGQRFIGMGEDTVLSGARTLAAADARREGAGRWYWPDQRQQSAPHGTLIGTAGGARPNPGDRYNEELFVTPSGTRHDPPRRYQRVLSLADLGPGRWYFDDAADRIYLTDDPRGLRLIETSVAPTAITAQGHARPSHVLIENLVVEKYASVAQQATIGGGGAVDWDFRDVTVRYNHGAGAELGPGTQMVNCRIDHMGQVGLLGGGDAPDRPTALRESEVDHNRTLSFDPDWEAGGAKFTRSFGAGMVVENSYFHDNPGGGLWFDIDNYNVVVRSNRFEDNDYRGLLYEVSRDARVHWNQVVGTRRGPENFARNGAAIVVFNSAGVQVSQNLLRDNANGVLLREDRRVTRWAADTYRQGLPHLHDVEVSDNDIAMRQGVIGTEVRNGDSIMDWPPSNARFAGNTYRLDPAGHQFLGAGNHGYTFEQWRGLGNDRDGRALPAASTGSLPSGAVAFAPSRYGANEGGD
jgi:hypothetical protein